MKLLVALLVLLCIFSAVKCRNSVQNGTLTVKQVEPTSESVGISKRATDYSYDEEYEDGNYDSYGDEAAYEDEPVYDDNDEEEEEEEEERDIYRRSAPLEYDDYDEDYDGEDDEDYDDNEADEEYNNDIDEGVEDYDEDYDGDEEWGDSRSKRSSHYDDDDEELEDEEEEGDEDDENEEDDDEEDDEDLEGGLIDSEYEQNDDDYQITTADDEEDHDSEENDDEDNDDGDDDDDYDDDYEEEEDGERTRRSLGEDDYPELDYDEDDYSAGMEDEENDDEDNYSYAEEEAFSDEELPDDDDEDYDYDGEDLGRIQKRFSEKTPKHRLKARIAMLNSKIHEIRSKVYYNTVPCWLEKADEMEELRSQLQGYLGGEGPQLSYTATDSDKSPQEMSTFELKSEIESLKTKISYFQNNPNYDKDYYKCNRELAESMELYLVKLESELAKREVNKPLRRMRGRDGRIMPDFTPREMEESNPEEEEEEEEDSDYDYYDYEEEESDRIQKRFVAPQSPPPGSANVEEMKKSAIRLTQHISAIRSKEYFKTLPCWQKRADNLESRRRRLLFRMMWLGIRVEREHTMSYPPKFLKEMSDAEILEEISSLNERIKRIRSSPDFNKEKYRCFKKLAENMSRYRQKLRRELNNRNPQMTGEGQRQERDAPMNTVEEESRAKRDCDEDDGADAPSISQLAAQTVQIEKEIQRKIASKLEDRLNQEVTQKTEEGVLQKTVESAIEKDIDDKVQKKLKQEAGSLPEKVRQLEKNYKELKDELENSPWSRFQQVMMDHVKENSEVGQSISKDEFQKLEQMHKMSKSERKAFTKALRKKIKLSKEEGDEDDDDDDDDKEIATKEKKVKAKPRPKKPKSGKKAKQQSKRRRKKPKSDRKKNKKKVKESKTEVDKKEPVKEVKAKPKKGNPQKDGGEKKELKQIKTGVKGKKSKGKKGKKTENGKKSKLLKKAKKVKTVAKSEVKKPQRKGKVPKKQHRQQLRITSKKQPKRPRGKKPKRTTKKLRPEQKKEMLLKKLREMSRKKSSKVDQQTKSRLKNKLGQGIKKRPRKMKTGKKKKPDKKEKRLRVKGKARALKKAKKERKVKKANGLKPDQKKALKRPAVQKKGKTLQDKTKALRGRESHQQKKRKLIEALKRKQQARKKLEKGKKKQKPQVIKKVIKIGTQGELNEQRQKQKVVGQEELNKRRQKNQQVLNKYIRLAAQGKFGRSKALKREKRGVEGSPGEWEISNTISQHNDPLHAQKKGGRSVSIRYQLPPKAETGGLWSSAVVKQPLSDPTHPLEWLGDYNQQNSQPGLKNRRSTNPFESNLETEKTRNEAIKTTDECSKCEVQVGEEVCGSNGKTYNSLCHAIHCGRLREMDVTFGPCEARDPCSHNHCSSSEICVPMTYGPCLTVYANNGRRLPCRQYICVAKEDCGHTEYSEVCGVDGETYPTLCHLQQRGVKLAYSGHCRQALCSGKVCGRNGVTYPSTCHARAHNVRVDYRGTCFAENLEDHVKSCSDVRRTGMCAPTDCPDAVIPEGACCPLCGGGVEVRPQAAQLAELVRDWPEINHLYMIENFLRRLVAREMQSQCELSLTLTDSGAIMMVLEAVDTHHSATCQAAAMDVAEKINRPSPSDDTLRPLARVARLLGGIGANSVQQSVEAQKNIVTGDISQAKAGATNKMINSYNDRVKGVESAAYEYEENSSVYVSASATLATVTTTLVLLLL